MSGELAGLIFEELSRETARYEEMRWVEKHLAQEIKIVGAYIESLKQLVAAVES